MSRVVSSLLGAFIRRCEALPPSGLTLGLTGAAPVTVKMRTERHRGVQCRPLVRPSGAPKGQAYISPGQARHERRPGRRPAPSLRYGRTGRRPCPGLLSHRPYGTSVWLAALASLANEKGQRRRASDARPRGRRCPASPEATWFGNLRSSFQPDLTSAPFSLRLGGSAALRLNRGHLNAKPLRRQDAGTVLPRAAPNDAHHWRRAADSQKQTESATPPSAAVSGSPSEAPDGAAR